MFQSYQDDGRVIMKGRLLWNPFTIEKISTSGETQTRDRSTSRADYRPKF